MEKNEHTCQRTHVQNYGYAIKVDVRTTLYCDCFFRQKMLQKFLHLGHVCCYLNCQCLNIFEVNKKKSHLLIYLFTYLFICT